MALFGSFSSAQNAKQVVDVTDSATKHFSEFKLNSLKKQLVESWFRIEETPTHERHFLIFAHRNMLNAVPVGVDPEWDALRQEFEQDYGASAK